MATSRTARAASPSEDLVRCIGRFETRSFRGVGGRGAAVLTDGMVLHRDAALKRPSLRLRFDPQALKQILEKAQYGSALNCTDFG